jgi:hypothetical protein
MSKDKPGPTTPEGKQIASQNAAKHHLTGRAPFIKGESPQAFQALLAQWQTDYPTHTVEAAKLVQEAALSEWILFRVQRQSDPIFVDLFNKEMANWDEANHKQYQLTQRYLTAAERKLERNRRNILQYRRELRATARELRDAQRFKTSQNNEQDEPKPAPTPEPRRMCDTPIPQDAYISVENGVTITNLQPPNEIVLRAQACRAQETLIKREIQFDCPEIPPEYAFCAPALARIDAPLDKKVFWVYHTLRTFATAIQREAASGGHVQQWPDLYQQDKHFIEEALAKQ